MWANGFAVSGIILICGFIGLICYARYFDCDPISAGVSLTIRRKSFSA